jgi:hypothetical protein
LEQACARSQPWTTSRIVKEPLSLYAKTSNSVRHTAGAAVRVAGCCLGPCSRRTGGARRDRTADPLLAKQVLSQLSYGPAPTHHSDNHTASAPLGNIHYRSDLSLGDLLVVGLGGLEPPTSPLSGVRSNRLSYRPEVTDHPVKARRASRGTASSPNGIKPKV